MCISNEHARMRRSNNIGSPECGYKHMNACSIRDTSITLTEYEKRTPVVRKTANLPAMPFDQNFGALKSKRLSTGEQDKQNTKYNVCMVRCIKHYFRKSFSWAQNALNDENT